MRLKRSRALFLLGALGVSLACSPALATTPYISSISPSSVTAGANAFVLTVNGKAFNSNSVVLWNGSPRPTTFVGYWKIQAQISRSDVAVAKIVTIKAMDRSTGQQSAGLTFKVLSPPSPTPPPQASGYTLMFADSFNSLNLSPNGTGKFNWYNPGMFWESPAPYSNISAANSVLNLLWKRGQGTSDTSLATTAKDGSSYRAWRYGYFEVRMRWDTVTGAWPAIWLIPVKGITCGHCEQGELDIFEGQGATPNIFTGTIHDWNSPTGNHSAGKNYNLGSVDLSQYHTYGVLWVPGQVTWYFDNQALYSFPTYPIYDQQLYYLIIGSQEGANWSYGNLSGVAASQIGMHVDWVRVWQP